MGRSGDGAPDVSSLDRLTPREREVLDLVAAGRENREIAGQLTLSVRTVERHLQTIYRKLDLSGSAQRTAAAALALGADDYARAAATRAADATRRLRVGTLSRGSARSLASGNTDLERNTDVTTTTDMTEADRALKAKHRAMWALGDYPAWPPT